MKYEKYQHICKLNDSETEGILDGTVYIFPKLDGSNCTCYLNDEGELKVGSRNRALTLIEDNQGCMAYVVSQPKFEQYLRKHPNHRLYGEWLCLSGDTIIRKTSAGKNGVNMTLRQMYKYSITPERDRDVSWWQRYGFPSIFSLYQDKDKILPNKIKNIVYTGDKEVYKITTRSGFSIKATKEHPFFTPYGFRPLMELKINDCVGVSRLLNSHRGRSYGKGTGYVLAQQKAYKDSVHQCEQCGAKEQLELHHKDGNAQNNDISNFQILCRQCHSALHHSNGGFFKGFQYDYVFDKIISIEYVGVEDCYDIEMEGTENEANFVANGFIVHNCKNSIKDYEDDAWRKVYIFDVIEYNEEGKMRYLTYEEYVPLLEEFDIKYIPLLAKLDNPTEEEVQEYVDKCTYLMKDNKPGEGCFGRNTRILMADGTYKKIVDVKIGDYVKSYNVETKEVENKKVINVFDNGVKPFKEWYSVTVNNKRLNTVDKAFNITKTHKIYNGDSFVPIENTQIAYMYEKVPDDYRKQAILGILCSDGCYHKAKGRDTISISQAKTKANAWINVLGDFITNSYVHISGKGSEICTYNIKQKYIDFILKDYKINDTLNFVKIFQSLDDVGWAYVFMGDGSGGDYAETDICIASYTDEEAENILVHFNKYFNTDAYLRFDKRVKNGSGASIRLRKADSIKFINRIGKYILEEYRYKIRHFDNIIFEEVPIYTDTYKLIPKTIYSKKEEIDMYRAKSGNYDGIHAYDLEVEDNHNYFAENMLVHNCVMKNYNYRNVYGRVTWAKIVRSAFKIAHKAKLPMDVDSIEEKITNDLCTPELIEKEYNKILNDNGGKWDSKCIPRFLGIFWHTFITEECFNMVKKYKEPKIDFRILHKFVIDKIKTVKSELF